MSEENLDFAYRCQDENGLQCAEACVGLDACEKCSCVTIALDAGGDWGEVMDVIFCLLPIVFLIVVIFKPNPLPTSKSLPLAAFFMFLVRLMYLGSDPLLTSASLVLGLHEAMTPISIMTGAMCLLETMEATYCLPYMMREMKALTAGHPIAELMLVFPFAYMMQGTSGFGTPVALGATMLVSMGHDPVKSVVTLLVMNAFSTVWGGVGTPTWFGFGSLFPIEEQGDAFIEISYKAGVCLSICAFLLILPLLHIICSWQLIRKNLLFIFLSLTTVIGPSLGLSFVFEGFPALIGGLVGCVGTTMLIKFKIGLCQLEDFDLEDRDILEIRTESENSGLAKVRISNAKTFSESHPSEGIGEDEEVDSEYGNDISNDNDTKEDGESTSNRRYEHSTSNISEISGDNLTSGSNRRQKSISERKPSGAITEDEAIDSEYGNDNNKDNNNAGKEDRTSNSTNEDDRPVVNTPDDLLAGSQQEMLERVLGPRKEVGEGYVAELLGRTSPIWLVVLLLVLIRLEGIGLKDYLIRTEPNFTIYFGTYGTFRLSASLVLQLDNILSYPGLIWKFQLLYLPFIMPMVLVSLFTMFVYRKDLQRSPKQIAGIVARRVKNPAIALLGALCLVQMLVRIDTSAPAYILGTVLADWFQEGYIVITPLLGALGTFFSGSTTVSNLTFGTIQKLAAESLGISPTSVLALQIVGASAGMGICLNNIIAACAVVGVSVSEGTILKQTYKFVFGITTITTLVMLAFFIRF